MIIIEVVVVDVGVVVVRYKLLKKSFAIQV